jgi:lipoic acid synthetase
MKNRLPLWFKQEIPSDEALELADMVSEFNVNTVCQEARCPNLSRCFKDLKLAFMILGNVCTRNCRFCAVNKSENIALGLDDDEPFRISQIVNMLGIRYVVITSVTRDDLSDGGAAQFVKSIKAIHDIDKNISPVSNATHIKNNLKVTNRVKVEVLIPDFKGDISSLKAVIAAYPEVIAHNIETVKGLYKEIRPKSSYQASLNVLRSIKDIEASMVIKSSIILGLGEREEEVVCTMRDLKNVGLDILTLGQYLSPGPKHYPIKEFITIEQFKKYRDIAIALGFKVVLSDPLVRSSYAAEETHREFIYA